MYIFRPVTVADLPAVEALAAQSPVGVTSLPANREALLHKIQASQDALAAEVRLYGEERYFFTVEDRASGRLLGLSGLVASAGYNEPFYSFRNELLIHASPELGIHNKMVAFHKFNSKEKAPELVKLMQEGATIAEISDAGMPVISDPGYILVQECIKSNVPVVPLPGPSAFATALIASGFDGQPFTYYGFLPRKASQQRNRRQAALNSAA